MSPLALKNPENYKVDSGDEQTRQNLEARRRLNLHEGTKPMMTVALVHVFGIVSALER